MMKLLRSSVRLTEILEHMYCSSIEIYDRDTGLRYFCISHAMVNMAVYTTISDFHAQLANSGYQGMILM